MKATAIHADTAAQTGMIPSVRIAATTIAAIRSDGRTAPLNTGAKPMCGRSICGLSQDELSATMCLIASSRALSSLSP